MGTPATLLTWAMIMSGVMDTVPASRTRCRAQAPSKRSIDLSGFFLSWMYRADSSTAAVMAAVSIMTL